MRIECSNVVIESVSSLKPNPNNLNKHSKKQIEVLAKIISKNGQRSPVIVSNLSGYVVKGHGRLEAIKLLGWDKCAVEYQDYKDEDEELRDRVADNEISRYTEFDRDSFLDEIKDLDIDFEEFGLIDFNFEKIDEIELDKKEDVIEGENKKFILEVTFSNDMEMMDIHDDLLHRGYIVRVKK